MTAARKAADASGGGEVHALSSGAPGIGARAADLGRYGADVVVVVEHAALERYSPEVYAATAAERIKSGGYRAAFFPASAEGRDLAPRVAAKLGAGLASDVTSFEVSGDAIVAKHPAYTGKIIVTLRLTGKPALVSLRPARSRRPSRPSRRGPSRRRRRWIRRRRASVVTELTTGRRASSISARRRLS